MPPAGRRADLWRRWRRWRQQRGGQQLTSQAQRLAEKERVSDGDRQGGADRVGAAGADAGVVEQLSCFFLFVWGRSIVWCERGGEPLGVRQRTVGWGPMAVGGQEPLGQDKTPAGANCHLRGKLPFVRETSLQRTVTLKSRCGQRMTDDAMRELRPKRHEATHMRK